MEIKISKKIILRLKKICSRWPISNFSNIAGDLKFENQLRMIRELLGEKNEFFRKKFFYKNDFF